MSKSTREKSDHVKLTKSSDEQFLLDHDGRKVARYIKELDMYINIDGEVRPKDTCVIGCRPYKYCIGWDTNGKCTNWAYSCKPIFGPCPE